jgi:hypothetical protein
MFTVSDSRRPQPGEPCTCIYISQEHGGPVISPGIRFPFRRLVRLVGSRWRYSTPPPHRLLIKIEVKVMLQPTVQSASLSWNKAPIWGLWLSDCCGFVDMWRSLWREDGSVVCQTQSALISLSSVCTIYMLQVIKCMYMQHMQGLCQFRLSTANCALSLVAPATTAV